MKHAAARTAKADGEHALQAVVGALLTGAGVMSPAPHNPRVTTWWGWAIAVVLVALMTGVSYWLHRALALPDPVMLYLLAVMVTAAAFGRGPALLSSALAVAAYDFFFVPPYFTFTIANTRFVLAFGMMFGVAYVMSTLVSRLKDQQREASAREAEATRLLEENRTQAEAARAASLRARTEELRSALLSTVSHDLRTPLAVITGAASTLRDEPRLDEATRAQLLDTVCDEAERLEQLVRNLLDMTRVQAGALRVKKEWVPADEVVGGARARLRAALEGRDVRLLTGGGVTLLEADPVLFEQVLVNLLENAARYTPPGTPVEVEVTADGQTATLTVRDRGPGFAAGETERLFEPFFRGQASRGAAGAGLGLSICRGIVEAHGGQIQARNREGGGAEFVVTIPAAPPPDVPEETP